MFSLTVTRAPRPFALLIVALLLAACGTPSGSPVTSPAASAARSPARSGTPATGGCATAPAPPANLDGWKGGAKTSGLVPSIITSQLVCGANRLLFGFTTTTKDSAGNPVTVAVGSPDRTAKVALYNLARDPKTPTMTVDATFAWAIEGSTGIYVANVTYPEAGEWGAEFQTSAPGGAPETIRVRYEVQAEGLMPGIGAKVPSVKTPTLADVGGDVKQIATDPTPNTRFYQVSEADAIAQHKPFVLIFATPLFCKSAVCGPTLDKVKATAAGFPDMTFINVEPYKLSFANGRLQPVLDASGALQATDATNAFSLLSEPWIYVVNGKGVVVASFETLASPDELTAAITSAQKG